MTGGKGGAAGTDKLPVRSFRDPFFRPNRNDSRAVVIGFPNQGRPNEPSSLGPAPCEWSLGNSQKKEEEKQTKHPRAGFPGAAVWFGRREWSLLCNTKVPSSSTTWLVGLKMAITPVFTPYWKKKKRKNVEDLKRKLVQNKKKGWRPVGKSPMGSGWMDCRHNPSQRQGRRGWPYIGCSLVGLLV